MYDNDVNHTAVDMAGRGFLIGAFVWAVVIGGVLGWFPTSNETSTSSGSSNGEVFSTIETESTTLLEEEGPSVLIVLAVPVVVAGGALAARRRTATLVAASVLAVLCVLGLMSIGIFYVPAVVLLFVAASRQKAA
jgi:hypothetical protein